MSATIYCLTDGIKIYSNELLPFFIALGILLPFFVYIMINEWFINPWNKGPIDTAMEESLIYDEAQSDDISE